MQSLLSTAPTARSKASVWSINCLEKSGLYRTECVHRADFSDCKDYSQVLVHLMEFGAAFLVKSDKGAEMVEKSGINL